MTRTIAISGGKGGIGKTVTVANLGAALAERGKNVIVVDANLTTSNLSMHLGIPFYPVTLHDVLKGKANIAEAIYLHPSGMRVIPASLSVNALKGLNASKLPEAVSDLLGKTEIILIDSAAGLGKEALAAMEASKEMLIVTNPEIPAVTDALKTIKMAEEKNIGILGAVVNKVKGNENEMSINEIQSMLDIPILAVLPEEREVADSIAMKVPVVHYSPKSRTSKEFRKLAAHLVGEKYIQVEKSLAKRLFGWLR